MTTAAPRRARSAAAKQQREQAILAAARTLGGERSVREVTLTDIAAAVGMHKSAMLRYFETREQIFLALTAEGWRDWSTDLRTRLAGLAGAGVEGGGEGGFAPEPSPGRETVGELGSGPGADRDSGAGPEPVAEPGSEPVADLGSAPVVADLGSGPVADRVPGAGPEPVADLGPEPVVGRVPQAGPDRLPEAVAAAIAASLVARPFFCDLLAQAPLNLERNVSLDAAAAFKEVALGEVAVLAAALGDLLGLTATRATDVIATATGMAGALWQMAAPGTQLRELYETRPELAHAVVDVEPTLVRILTALLRGMRESGRGAV